MFRLALIACLVAVATAALKYAECGDMQRLKVKAQWHTAFGYSENRESLDEDLWVEIIAKNPEIVERYFGEVRGDNIYSPEFRAHAARVMAGFDMTISMIDDPTVFDAQIAHLNKQHVTLDVDAKYFDAFLEALLHVVQSRVGRCFDQDAWKVCGALIEEGIKHN